MTQMPGWRKTHFCSSRVVFFSWTGSPESSSTEGRPSLSGVSEIKTRDTTRPMAPAAAAARNPHCQPAAATIKPVMIMETALPSWGVEEKMPYMVPRLLSGNHRLKEMVPGGEPMDCIQPLMPQRSEKAARRRPAGQFHWPRRPRMRFMRADIPIPTAMKRRMLQ